MTQPTQNGVVENAAELASATVARAFPPVLNETVSHRSEQDKAIQQLIGRYRDSLLANRSFASITEARRMAEPILGAVQPGTALAKAVDEAMEVAIVHSAVLTVMRGAATNQRLSARAIFRQLVDLYQRQPNLAVRSSDSAARQAYSTPVPIAYLAAMLADIGWSDRVYDPTAGNGALLITANPANVTANELDSTRAAELRRQGYVVTEHDATRYVPQEKFSRLIANPPFGVVRDSQNRTQRFAVTGLPLSFCTTEIDQAIALQALNALESDGKAALILMSKRGEDEETRSERYNSQSTRLFYYLLYNEYRVTQHITISGELYRKQGAAYPVDLLIIEGRGKSERSLPAADVPKLYRSFDELAELLPEFAPKPERAIVISEPAPVVQQAAAQSVAPSSNLRRDGEPKSEVEAVASVVEEEAEVLAAPPSYQVAYTPQSKAKPIGTLVPQNMQSAIAEALSNLEDIHGPVDEFVCDRLGYRDVDHLWRHFAAEQIDSIGLAIHNLERGSACIIGDQTGIGKGRQVAAMIRYAQRTNRIPIFVTKETTLYADMIRDLQDIDVPYFMPFVTNSDLKRLPLPDGRSLSVSRETQTMLMQQYLHTCKLEGYDGIFTTYTQLQTVNQREPFRRDFLRRVAPHALLILDESHEAGGKSEDSWSDKKKAPNRAEFTRELISLAQGTIFSSATYAKNPEVMPLYATTDLRLALDNVASLVNLVTAGGIPLQQSLAVMLTQAGQYVRRERSFAGVEFKAELVPVDEAIADAMAECLRAIMDFDFLKKEAVSELNKTLKAEAKALKLDNAVGDAGASSTNFPSLMHNIISQSLLAFKSAATVDLAIKKLQQDQKVVIAVSNTMGAFIGKEAADLELLPGDPVNLSFSDLLLRYLNRSRFVLVQSPLGLVSREWLSDQWLREHGGRDREGRDAVQLYDEAKRLIERADFDGIPISPIDYMLSRLRAAGYQVDELTGRTEAIEYLPTGEQFYRRRPPKEVSKSATVRKVKDFNDGKLDVLILNRSGSSGISLHASEKFADTRPRHLMVAQAESEINTFMQVLGRVHRTGQKSPPSYSVISGSIPAEKRPTAVLLRKLASLNANTIAARNSGFSLDTVCDFLNAYGDIVVESIMEDNPEIHEALGFPLDPAWNLTEEGAIVRKVTGRIPLLPVAEQTKLYDLIEREYEEFAAQQEALGESILEAATLDLDAKTVNQEEMMPASGVDSPFAGAVYLETLDAKSPRRVPTKLEVVNSIRASLGLKQSQKLKDYDPAAIRELAIAQHTATLRQLVEQIEQYKAAYFKSLRPLPESAPKGEVRKRDAQIAKFEQTVQNQAIAVAQMLKGFPPGTTVQLTWPEELGVAYGVVTRVWSTQMTQNPVALGGWRVRILLADANREMTLKLNRVNTGDESDFTLTAVAQDSQGNDILDLFTQRRSKPRERIQVITGNLLRAYDKIRYGKIINFTTQEGTIRQGLFYGCLDIADRLEAEPVKMPSVEVTLKFINEVTKGRGKVQTLGGGLVIQRNGSDYQLETSVSKKIGGKFYLNQQLLEAAAAQFYSVGQQMRMQVSADRIHTVLKVLGGDRGNLCVVEQRDLAREMLGITLPKAKTTKRKQQRKSK